MLSCPCLYTLDSVFIECFIFRLPDIIVSSSTRWNANLVVQKKKLRLAVQICDARDGFASAIISDANRLGVA